MFLAAFGFFSAVPQTPSKSPNPVEAARLNNLGVAYMNQQLFEKGLKSFQAAVEADPTLAIARLNAGVAYLNLQKVDQAKTALDEALKQDPKSPNAWYSLGLLAKNTGDSQAAIDAFKRVTEIDPSDADTWYFLGTSYAQAKQFPQAIEAFERALKISPLHASAEFGLSRAYQQSAEVDHAREHLKKFQYITQNKLGAPMSLAYGEQGQYSRAVESPQAQLKPPAQIKVQFVDVTKEAGLIAKPGLQLNGYIPSNLGPGACFLDYDNDGKLDVLLADNGIESGVSLFHNLGGGKFEDQTKSAGLDLAAHSNACTAGDYDNDGFVDLVLTSNNGLHLFHNEKNGTFKEVSNDAGITPNGKGESKEKQAARNVTDKLGDIVSEVPVGVTFLDYDHDGDLDLYVTQSTPQNLEDEGISKDIGWREERPHSGNNLLWRNNGDGTFTDVTLAAGLSGNTSSVASVGSDYNNDRAIDVILTGGKRGATIFENPREGMFKIQEVWPEHGPDGALGVAVGDFDHDGWMDLVFTHLGSPAISLWRNDHGKKFKYVSLPDTNWVRAFGVAAFDYDNDGWVDLVAVGETKDGKGEIKLLRNLGPDGFKDVTTDVGLDKIHLEAPRAIITGDYDNDGAVDLLITQNHGPAVLLRNEGGNKNHWLRLALKGLADNKSAIGTKVEVFSGGNRQKFEIYGSNGYLGQNSPYLTVGLGDSKEADIVRMLWPTGVLQDEIEIAGDQQKDLMEIDRRGSSCPTLFAWNGERYEFVADMLGAAVVGHWIAPNQRDTPRPVEYIKIPTGVVRDKLAIDDHQKDGDAPLLADFARSGNRRTLSFRFMEPLEEAVYLDQVRLLAVDHPANVDVYPNEYFASNPTYPEFKVVVSRDAKPPAAAWDDHGHNVLPDLLAHRYIGDFTLTQFAGFAQPHTLTLDLGEPYDGGPLWLLMHGEVEYFTANSMYAASQAGLQAFAPYLEALDSQGTWKRVVDDMGFPAGGPRTMTADLTGKLPRGTQQIRLTTNLQLYWDNILLDRSPQASVAPPSRRLSKRRPATDSVRESDAFVLTPVPLVHADLDFHGYPLKIEGTPAGNVHYIYEKASATGPYTRPSGTYTRYGDVLPLLTATDDKLAVFGSGDEVRLDFDPSHLPALPTGWVRDYFFAANGYEKDMDFYAADGNYVAPLPFLNMREYPYPSHESFPLDDSHVNYLLEYNTRHMSGNEQRGYRFDYPGPAPASAPKPSGAK
jgi:tetratricopeptide (TPR) repeat protein